MKKQIALLCFLACSFWACGNTETNKTTDNTKEYQKLILGKWQSNQEATRVLTFEQEGKYAETKQNKPTDNTYYICKKCAHFGEEMKGNDKPCIYIAPQAMANGILYVLDKLTETELEYTDYQNVKHSFKKVP
jgi:hypothetical protein